MFANLYLMALITIFRKEVVRILRIWTQTLLPSVITTVLYFLIFGKFIGSRVGEMNGVSYVAFIVPGLVMMAIITNSFTNVAGSFFGAKFQKSIEEILVAPVPNWVIVAGYVLSGMFRGFIVGLIVLVISLFFTNLKVHNLGLVIIFTILTSAVFSLAGLTNGMFAKKFDHVMIVPTFVITPLTYLGGVFYSISSLPPFWQNVSKLNPVLYMVDGFRYGFFGVEDINIWISLTILIVLTVGLTIINLNFLNKGTGLKA